VAGGKPPLKQDVMAPFGAALGRQGSAVCFSGCLEWNPPVRMLRQKSESKNAKATMSPCDYDR
jgi:hypothetical protein